MVSFQPSHTSSQVYTKVDKNVKIVGACAKIGENAQEFKFTCRQMVFIFLMQVDPSLSCLIFLLDRTEIHI